MKLWDEHWEHVLIKQIVIHYWFWYNILPIYWDLCHNYCFFSLRAQANNLLEYSHKKWKDSLETRAVLLIISLQLEISGVAIQSIHQNSKKWWLLWGIAQWKWLWGCFSHFLLIWPWCQLFWGSSEDHYRSKRVS